MGITKSVAKWAVGAAVVWFLQNKVFKTKSKKYSSDVKKKHPIKVDDSPSTKSSTAEKPSMENKTTMTKDKSTMHSGKKEDTGTAAKKENLSTTVQKENVSSSSKSPNINADGRHKSKAESV